MPTQFRPHTSNVPLLLSQRLRPDGQRLLGALFAVKHEDQSSRSSVLSQDRHIVAFHESRLVRHVPSKLKTGENVAGNRVLKRTRNSIEVLRGAGGKAIVIVVVLVT